VKKFIKRCLYLYYKLKYRVPNLKRGDYIGKHCKIVNGKKIKFGYNVEIAPYSLLCPHGGGEIHLEEGVQIGMFSRINANNNVRIGKNTITGPNVFISDHNHNYLDPNQPIKEQGDLELNNTINIEEDCWIGTNVCIVGNVPPPKKYNFITKLWEKVI